MRKMALLTAASLLAVSSVGQLSLAWGQVDLDQGWSDQDRSNWYEATQGSRLIPLSWLKALEQPGGTEPFLADSHIIKFRYLPRTTSGGERLPVGFALDDTDDEKLSVTKLRWKGGQRSTEPWVGLNCSACHTAELTFGQHR